MRRFLALAVGIVAAASLTACGVGPAPSASAPPPAFTYTDTWRGIDQAFAPRFGWPVAYCARLVAIHESGGWPYADNGTHHGPFQLHDGFYGSLQAAAASRGEAPDWHNPYQNALAAAQGFAAHGTFHYNWPGTAPSGCP